MEQHYLIINSIYFILGTILGSFLNVVILRYPINLSIISPRSHCLSCKEPIPFYFNVPIISYIILKGKCAKCNAIISKQYIIIELLSGFLFYIVFSNLNLSQSLLLTLVFSCYLILGTIDYRYLLIPKNILIILFFCLAIKPFVFDCKFIDLVIGSTILTFYLGILILLVGLIKKDFKLIGFGDIILIIIIGGWLEIYDSFICLFLASLLGIIMMRIPISISHAKNKISFGYCLSISFICVSVIVECYKIDIIKLFFL